MYTELHALTLTHLQSEIVSCWQNAERETAKDVLQKYYDPPEEFVTRLFCGELRYVVGSASEAGLISQAFVKDLLSIPDIDRSSVWDIQRMPLVATVNFHNQKHESRISASDLGIVITRPTVTVDPYGHGGVQVRTGHASGLLAQAKLGRYSKDRFKWGRLRKRQESLFPEVNDFYAILLYRLTGERFNELQPFGWHLCKDHSLDEIKSWLRSDGFPKQLLSEQIIGALFSDVTVGIQDQEIIKKVIDPNKSPLQVIDIEISWPDGPPSDGSLRLITNQEQQVEQHLKY
ncbi:MAG TPA: hypothetical protein VKZ53_27870 [Candidatus Angelobacter sp.]|nr:hypothetical protein [Candidatus Angelobacter sp.]